MGSRQFHQRAEKLTTYDNSDEVEVLNTQNKNEIVQKLHKAGERGYLFTKEQIKEIAAKEDVHKSYILYLLDREEIDHDTMHHTPTSPSELQGDKTKESLRIRAEGETNIRKISDKVGCAYKTSYEALQKYGWMVDHHYHSLIGKSQETTGNQKVIGCEEAIQGGISRNNIEIPNRKAVIAALYRDGQDEIANNLIDSTTAPEEDIPSIIAALHRDNQDEIAQELL